ncbi:MAG: hypothetical protein KQH79_14080 [Bacteroidetes bacterium]|nr:hypothetical protein [Bacteroidota bacterium]
MKDLKDILKTRLVRSDHNQGLLLLNLPTGFGKTHYVIEYLADSIKSNSSKKIWFITDIKNNLPWKKLKNKIGKEKFYQHCLFLDAYTESVKSYIHNNSDDLPKPFRNWVSWPPLKRWAKAHANAQENGDKEFERYAYENLCRYEQEFRKQLRKFLSDKLKGERGYTLKLNKLRTDKDLQWIIEMYPSVRYFETNIYFCSVKKFYHNIDTIIDNNITITDDENIKGNIVFIDEFDATKSDLIDLIIDNSISINQDILGMFTVINNGLQSRGFPSYLFNDKETKEYKGLKERFNKCVKMFQSVYSEYQFNKHFFYTVDPEERVFLFNDSTYHTVSCKDDESIGKILSIDYSGTKNQIYLDNKIPTNEKNNLLYLINYVRGCLNTFAFLINAIAKTYTEISSKQSEEQESEVSKLSPDNAVRTILDLFDVREINIQNYILTVIFQKVRNESKSLDFDNSPLANGFRYYDLLNQPVHNETCRLMYNDTVTTPEAWLINLCSKAMVIGISATAGFDSPLSNYYLSYIKHHLGNDFHSLNSNEELILHKKFEDLNSLRHKNKIKVKCIDSDLHEPVKNLERLISDKEICSHINELVFNGIEEKNFAQNRYLKLAEVYKYYIENNIKSMLVLSNRLPKDYLNDDFNFDKLKELLSEVRSKVRGESIELSRKQVENEVYRLNSDEFKKQYHENIKLKLEKGENVFLISSFRTLGAGQNLQYKKPKGIDIVKINNLDYEGDEKDYDAIYIEKPTYLFSWFSDDTLLTHKDLLKYVFELEYLYHSGIIDYYDKKERIKFAFKRYHQFGIRTPYNKHLLEHPKVAQHAARTIIQAVGRLSRANYKSPTTHILYDIGIKDYLKNFKKDQFLLIEEFKALYDHCVTTATPEYNESQNISVVNSLLLAQRLESLVSNIGSWNERIIEVWKNMREHVLKFPTASNKELSQIKGISEYYLKTYNSEPISQYTYSTKDDFKTDLQIFYNDKGENHVSKESARLDKIFKIPGVKDLFIKNEYATQFIPKEYIISPPLYRNIYLGALGEVVGKHILETYIPDIKLYDLPLAIYELFDFKVNDAIYVDFKYWKETTIIDNFRENERIKDKMQRVNAQNVIVINILAKISSYEIQEKDGIIQIPYLWNFSKNRVNNNAINKINQILDEFK